MLIFHKQWADLTKMMTYIHLCIMHHRPISFLQFFTNKDEQYIVTLSLACIMHNCMDLAHRD